MTQRELVAALVDECRESPIKVEDFLAALADTCAETLEKGESFHLGDIGALAVNPRRARSGHGFRAAVTFQASKKFRARLKLPPDEARKTGPGMCKYRCGRPGKVRVYDECDPCMHARSRRERREAKR